MTSERIKRLLRDERLEKIEPDAEAVLGWWQKALDRWRSYQSAGLPRSVGFQLVYTAAFQLATAVLQAEGLRTRSGSRDHHWTTYHALRGLDDAKIDVVARKFEAARTLRHATIYDPSGGATSDQMDDLVNAVEAFFSVARDHIEEALPKVEGDLELS